VYEASEWRATLVEIEHAKPPAASDEGDIGYWPIVDGLGGMRNVRILEESGRPELLLPTEIPKLDCYGPETKFEQECVSWCHGNVSKPELEMARRQAQAPSKEQDDMENNAGL
jgi:hypothetical protein